MAGDGDREHEEEVDGGGGGSELVRVRTDHTPVEPLHKNSGKCYTMTLKCEPRFSCMFSLTQCH